MSTKEEITRIRVEMTVNEEVTYQFLLTVEVPADVAGDPDALEDYLTVPQH